MAKMIAIIEAILLGELKVEHLILWLNSQQIEDKSKSILSNLDEMKQEFIPQFLNFLKEQTCRVVQTNTHTGLTPNKSALAHVTKYISPSKLSRKPSLNKSSKAKTLDFSSAPGTKIPRVENSSPGSCIEKDLTPFVESEDYSNFGLPLHTPIKSQNKFNSPWLSEDSPNCGSVKYNTSTPKHFSFSPNSTTTNYRRHSKGNSFESIYNQEDVKSKERKYVLADYVISEKSHKKKKNLTSKLNTSSELSPKAQLNTENESCIFDIDNAMDFPPVGSEAPNNKAKAKRIKPTLVTVPLNKKSSNSNECFGVPSVIQFQDNAFLVAEENKPKSFEVERKLLKEQKEKIKCNTTLCNTKNLKPNQKKIYSSKSKFKCDPEKTEEMMKVTNKLEIDAISQIYSSLINFNMVPNIMVEVNYLLQVLVYEATVNDQKECTYEENGGLNTYFQSINNCVYFAVNTLALIFEILKMFGRNFIRILSENSRIYKINTIFYDNLINFYENTSPSALTRVIPLSPIQSVSFQTETDNKNNFPSSASFQTFRKQRDLFYEIIRNWEDKHLSPDWCYSQSLGYKINQLLSLRSDAVNYAHFARLFLSQLITMCKENEQSNLSSETDDLLFLNQLKRQNPEKYKRLHERLITPSKAGGPVPLPSFPGTQEFFKDFIDCAGNYSFNIHLRDALISKILQLNSMNLDIADLEENELFVLKDEAWSALKHLRLLAKFLGYIEFFPYKTCEALSDNVVVSQVQLRNYINPALSLWKILQEGASKGCLLMVVTWMVELLSMVDAVAFHTQYYLTLIFELIYIYKQHYMPRLSEEVCNLCIINGSSKFTMAPMNCLYLKLILGWLFSLPNIPENVFFAQVEDAEIDHSEYKKTTQVIMNSYACYCIECFQCTNRANLRNDPNCLYKSNQIKDGICRTASDSVQGLFCSPIKSNRVTPLKKKTKALFTSTVQGNVDSSPLKTPSKYLDVSMLDTPMNTPDKQEIASTNTVQNLAFDSVAFIDEEILYTCCPFINELKSIINDFSMGSTRFNSGCTFRKITPLSTLDKSNEQPGVALQLQLEDNFFHNQPSSTKKTVDFFIERIYSNVVGNVRFTIIPTLKDDCLNRLKSCVSSGITNFVTMDKLTEATEKKIHALSHDLSLEIREMAIKNMENLLKPDNVEPSLQYLLRSEVSKKGIEICCSIIGRMVREKIAGWLNSHLSPGFCSKELTTEAKKFIKQSQKVQHNESTSSLNDTFTNSSFTLNSSLLNCKSLEDHSFDLSTAGSISSIFKDPAKESQTQFMNDIAICHNLDAIAPSMMLQQLKKNLKKLTTGAEELDWNLDLLVYLKDIHCTITERKDMTLAVYKAIEALSIDLIAAICVSKPNLITEEVTKFFIQLWSPESVHRIFSEEPNFSVFMVPRNIMLLGQQGEEIQKLSWRKLESILIEMIISSKFMSTTTFQGLCIALLQHEWPPIILKSLSSLIKNVVSQIERSSHLDRDPDTSLLTDWVGWICSEMEEF